MGNMDDIFFIRKIEPDLQQVIAGTFCLMSCTMMSGGAIYLSKIIDNLNYLADDETLDASLRTLCRRMACHWEAQQLEKCQGLAAMPQQDDTTPFVITAGDAVEHDEPATTLMTSCEALAYANDVINAARERAAR